MSLLQTFTGAGVGGAITAAYRAGYQTWEKVRANFVALNAQFATGTGSPEGVVTAGVGSKYFQTDGVYPLIEWIKASGSGNTGWLPTSPFGVKSVPLTDAQIKLLPTTSVLMLAAPGAGYRIKVIAASFGINNAAGGYTNLNTVSPFLQLQYGSAAGAAGPALANQAVYDTTTGGIYPTELLELLSNAPGRKNYDFIVPYSVGIDAGATGGDTEWNFNFSHTLAETESIGVYLGMDNGGSGNLTGGNIANSGRVHLYYGIEVLP